MNKILNNEYNQIQFITVYDRMHRVDELIEKYRDKFSKYSVGISYTKEPTKVTVPMYNVDTALNHDVEVDAVKITINIEIPVLKHEGWTYFGTIERVPILDENEKNTGYENIIYSPIQDNPVIKKFINITEFNCDHCKTKHHRKTVHLLKHEDGREFLIGTACSKEYFGINIHKQICELLNLFPKIVDFAEDCEESFGFGGIRYSINKGTLAKLAYGILKNTGRYISKASCDEFSSEIPTATRVSTLYDTKDKEAKEYRDEILESLKDKEVLQLVREYWDSKDDGEVFTHNVQTALKMIDPKPGLIAYAVWEYMREVEDITGKNKFGERLKNSNYIGKVGEKIKGIEVEIYNIASFESMYGTTFIISMIDNSDNVIVWKTSSPVGEKGEKYIIKTAIIKEHADYKSIKQTVVKNLKFI